MIRSSASLACALALALAVLGCGQKTDPPAGRGSGTAAASPADAAVAAVAAPEAAAATTPTRAAPKALSKATRAEYKLRLAAGRKASKAARWPAAITALEAALVAIPGDERALAELSWAALSAGDHAKARLAGRQAVLVATDPKVKAAALYNLGRVDEATDAGKAAALYRESLALRPNPIVSKRLADLATKLPSTPAPLPCAAPIRERDLCACLQATTELPPGDDGCTITATGLIDFKLATYRESELGEENVALIARSQAGWSVVAEIAYVYNPGMFGISEDWKLDRATDEQLGGRSLARFVMTKARQDSDLGIDEIELESTTDLVICVRDDSGLPPTCPLAVQTHYDYTRDRLGMAEEGELGDVAEYQTKGLPITTRATVDVSLSPDGVAHVRAVRGRVEPAVLGDKRLW